MRRVIIIFISIFLVTSSLYSFSPLVKLTNEYIKIIGHPESGRFIIKTTGGDPELDTDQNADLLKEEYPPTSLTTLRIDERDYIFGDTGAGYFVTRLMERDGKMICVWSARNIEITQILKIVKGPTTGRMDTVEISYIIWNKDSREHNIGIRIMLDTYLGGNDNVPFKLPGIGDVTTETALYKDNIPDYWYAFDNLINPNIRVQGTLKVAGANNPDKVIFANWGKIRKNLWDFVIEKGKPFLRPSGEPDSAIAIYWFPRKFNPNDTFTVATYYGLYGAMMYKGRIFNVSLGGPVTSYGEPFLVTSDIQNISPYRVKDVTAEIILPQGLKLMGDEIKKKSMGSFAPQEIKRTSWNIFPDGSVTGIMSYKVKVTGIVEGKTETVIVERKINYKKKEVKKAVEYTLYDFSEINKLIAEMNALIRKNNEKIDELNKLIQQKGPYSTKQAAGDKKEIKKKIEKSKDIEKRLPAAVKSIIKKIKK